VLFRSPGGFGVVLADPPWRHEDYSPAGDKSKTPGHHYPTMPLADIMLLPVKGVAAADAACFLWVTAPHLLQGFAVLAAWGFEFKTAGAWAKQSSTGEKWAFGTGQILRSAAEFYLIGTRGSPSPRSASVRNLIVAPRREHSRKPDQLHADAEALYAGPYLELFARSRQPGWTVWGDQTDRFEEA